MPKLSSRISPHVVRTPEPVRAHVREAAAHPLAICDHPGSDPEGGDCTCWCADCHVALRGREKCVCTGCRCGHSR